jgi:hypothetical protein
MYSDVRQWERIRERILVRGDSCRSVAASVGMSRNTVRKMVRHELPPGYRCSSPRIVTEPFIPGGRAVSIPSRSFYVTREEGGPG